MANIHTSRRSGFILRGGVQRRQTFWFSTLFSSNTLAAGTPVLIGSLNAAALALRPFTIVRTRGELMCMTDQEAVDESQLGAYGEIIVSDQSVAIGVTAVPTPVTDSQSDWHVYQTFLSTFRFGTAVAFANIGTRYSLDSKAMRKVSEGQDLIQVIENSAAGGGVNTLVATKQLIKLH